MPTERKRGKRELRPRDVAILSARIAHRMKGEEIVVFNVRRIFPLADYFVIVTTRSRLHAQSLCSEIEHRLKEKGLLLSGMEGYEDGRWILMDYDDVVVHIFLEEVREFYDLEMLWGDARRIKWRH